MSVGSNVDFRQLKKINVNMDQHRSFGCGLANPYGLRMKFATGGEKVYSQVEVQDHLCSWQDLIHGGIVGTILDEIMFWSGMYFLKQIVLTKKSTVEIKCPPSFQYQPLTAVGYIKDYQQSNSSVVVTGELYNKNGTLYATSVGDFAVIDPAIADRLNILTIEDVEMVKGFIDSF